MRLHPFLLILAVVPQTVIAAEPVQLKPATQWVLDYGDNSCRLLRNFGDPAKPTLLFFETASPRSPTSMVVVGKVFQSISWAESNDITVHFLPSGNASISGGQASTSTTSGEAAVMWPGIAFIPTILMKQAEQALVAANAAKHPSPADPARLALDHAKSDAAAESTTAIEISSRHGTPVVLETGSLGRPFKMLQKCARDSLRDWGIDPDVEDKIASPPRPLNPTRWLDSNDYPESGISRGIESKVEARILVDAVGKATGCTPLSHFDAPEFGKAVCAAITKRARFQPAELADGTKVPSYFMYSVQFRIMQ